MMSHHGDYELTMKVGDRIRIKGEDPEEMGTIEAPGSIFDWKVVLDGGLHGPTLSAFNEIEMEVVGADHVQ